MKNLDPKYLAQRQARKNSLEQEFQQPGSVILLGTAVSGFTIYAVAAMGLIIYDVFIKVFN